MYKKNKIGTLFFGYFSTFGYLLIAPCFPFEIYDYVQRNIYLNGSQFWYHAVGSVGSCVRVCLRMPMCKSFNFELKGRKCEMNNDTLENNPYQQTRRSGWIYSKKTDWPEETSPDCFSPSPCKEDEVCIPKQLASIIGSSSCMKAVRRVPPCPTEWLLYGGSCYYISLTRKNWAGAAMDCWDKESHLAEIESEKEQRYLRITLTKLNTNTVDPYTYWTFGNDNNTEGHWIWGHSGRKIDAGYSSWQESEPSTDSEHCLALYSGYSYEWADVRCDLEENFICEKPEQQ